MSHLIPHVLFLDLDNSHPTTEEIVNNLVHLAGCEVEVVTVFEDAQARWQKIRSSFMAPKTSGQQGQKLDYETNSTPPGHVVLLRTRLSPVTSSPIPDWRRLVAEVRQPPRSLEVIVVLTATATPADEESPEVIHNITAEILRAGAFACFFNQCDLAALASHVANASEKNRRAVAFMNYVDRLLVTQDAKSIADIALETLHSMVGWDKATFVIVGSYPDHPDLLFRSMLARRGYSEDEVSQKLLQPMHEDADSFMYEIVKSGHPKVLADLQNPPPEGWTDEPETRDIKSWLALPLQQKDNVIGLITLDHRTPGQYAGVDDILLRRIASETAVAIDRSLRTRNAQCTQRVMETISTKYFRVEDLLQEVVKAIRHQIPSSRCTYFQRKDNSKGQVDLQFWLDEQTIVPETERHPTQAGIAHWVLTNKKPRLVPETSKDTDFTEGHHTRDNPRAIMSVPVMIGQRAIGVINVDRDEIGYFSPYDLDLVHMLADQVAVIIERTGTLQLINDTISNINRTQDLDEVLQEIVTSALNLTNATSGVIHHLQREANDKFGVIRSYSVPKGFSHPLPRLEGDSFTLELIQKRKVIQQSTCTKNADQIRAELKQKYVTAVIGAPLIYKDEPIGVLFVNSTSKECFTDVEVFSLGLFANHAAIAIKRDELLEETKQQSSALLSLLDADNELMVNDKIQPTFETIIKQTCKLVGAHFGHLALVDWQDDRRRLQFVAAWPLENLEKLRKEIGYLDLESGGSQRNDGRIGVVGLAVKRAAPILVPDVDKERNEKSEIGEAYINYESSGSELAVPIVDSGNNVIGVLNAEHATVGGLKHSHIELLKLFAQQAAIAIQKNKLIDEKSEAERQLKKLAEATQIIMTDPSGDLHTAMHQVIKMVRDALDAYDVIIIPVKSFSSTEPDRIEWDAAISYTELDSETIRACLDGISSRVLKTGTEFINYDINKYEEGELSVNQGTYKIGVKHVVCLPLSTRPVGVMWLHFKKAREHVYSDGERYNLHLFARQIGLAYDNIRQAQADKKILTDLQRDITQGIEDDYKKTREQSQIYFGVSVGLSVIGVTLIFLGAIAAFALPQATLLPGLVTSLAGVVMNTISILIIRQAANANSRMDTYHKELLQIKLLRILLESAEKVNEPKAQDNIQQKIVDLAATKWFAHEAKTMGAAPSQDDSSAASPTSGSKQKV